MSFLGVKVIKIKNKTKEKISLQAYPELWQICSAIRNERKKHPRHQWLPKRMSRFPLSLEGSVTLEAALAVPLFLFFFINIISLILTFHSFSDALADLHQQGKKLATYAYAAGAAADSVDNMIRLSRIIPMEPVIAVPGFRGSRVMAVCQMHTWTGYDVTRGMEAEDIEIMVYITENGSVYHTNRSCTHLSLSITPAPGLGINDRTNLQGSRYRPCALCPGGNSSLVYITGHGTKYHSSVTCSGLKRTVKCVPVSEAGGYPPCSRCA